MIIDTGNAHHMIASWDAWKGNGYAQLTYPSVSIASATHMLGRVISTPEGRIPPAPLTDKEADAIEQVYITLASWGPQLAEAALWWVRSNSNASAVARETGIERKAVEPLAKAGLDFIAMEYRRKNSS